MSERITIMVIPGKGNSRFSFSFTPFGAKTAFASAMLVSMMSGYLIFDYLNLVQQRKHFYKVQKENRILKSEAEILDQNLETVKKSLINVHSFTQKINELMNLRVTAVKHKTGIGPLTKAELVSAKTMEKEADAADSSFPIGINPDQLSFKSLFTKLSDIQGQSNTGVTELQHLLASLSQKQSLLSSIPSISPTKGWITSKFGKRVSPFTGEISEHRGLDIAAAVGSHILATADGVVIFSGTKADFGNMVMIAHYENGIVTKYGHNAENLVTVGQRVVRGEQIASVGMTGNTTGPHVHYEVWLNGEAVDPKNFILDSDSAVF